jgi:proteasome lid subunit RPN8/RPN11
MLLRISKEHEASIRAHGARDYPNECCGILVGQTNGDAKEVREVVALKNLRMDSSRAQEILPVENPGRETERNRFLIDPIEQLRVEKDARARGLEVLGYYHSHPDHPARPSEYDREHAWPWYSYVILSVRAGTPEEITSWVLSDDRARFLAEPLNTGSL